jgi:RNA polymerase sigma-70 factor (ECF subfamily)
MNDNDAIETFNRLRPRLQGIAYRMLGTLAEAEDIVQDAWCRWQESDRSGIGNAEAWLVATTSRLSIDRLRAAKVKRDHYEGLWLPEPMLMEASSSPEQLQEISDDLSVAFLMLLERLSPEARAAFLLREVFDLDYREVAEVIQKSEAASRQLVSRAKKQLQDGKPRYAVSADAQRRLLGRFTQALSSGDFAALNSMLAEEAELIGDGGGIVTSFPKPMLGGRRIAQLFYANHLRYGSASRSELAFINGQWALLRFIHGELESAQTFDIDGERIVRVLVQRNPEKLARLAAARAAGGALRSP